MSDREEIAEILEPINEQFRLANAEIARLRTEVSGLKSTIQDNLDDAVLSCDYYGIEPSKTAIEAFQRLTAASDRQKRLDELGITEQDIHETKFPPDPLTTCDDDRHDPICTGCKQPLSKHIGAALICAWQDGSPRRETDPWSYTPADPEQIDGR